MIPQGVEVKINQSADMAVLNFNGKEGTITLRLLPFVLAETKDNQLFFRIEKNYKQSRANWGTMAALAKNAITGVSQGYGKILDIEGIGFRAAMEGADLSLNVGFSHPVKFTPPAGVKVSVEKNSIKIFGVDKSLVGEVAAQIRKIKKPEPYQGKGIRYRGEVIRRKAGKKVAGAGTGAGAGAAK